MKRKKPSTEALFRGQKASAVILTGKASREIILALRCMKRNTERERAYLLRLADKIEKMHK